MDLAFLSAAELESFIEQVPHANYSRFVADDFAVDAHFKESVVWTTAGKKFLEERFKLNPECWQHPEGAFALVDATWEVISSEAPVVMKIVGNAELLDDLVKLEKLANDSKSDAA